jgi:hypothetical protein
MDTVLKSLSANAPQVILILCILVLILTIAFFMQARRLRRMGSRWKELMDGTKGDNLERLLYDHLRERMQQQAHIDGMDVRISTLEEKMMAAKRYVGLVKYDAFEDVGGSQSFALAIFDDRGDGALVTSLVGRSDCRVYCKPLLGGKSERSLSQEEQRAIQDATQSGPRSFVSQ